MHENGDKELGFEAQGERKRESMKKRFLGMVTAGILATVMLAGCGASASKVTAESLLQEVQSKCDAMKSLETHTTARSHLSQMLLAEPWI